jgi:hypothetical protein
MTVDVEGQILSTEDLQDLARVMSDDSLTVLTNVTRPEALAVLRAGLHVWAYDCGTYLAGEEEQYVYDFLGMVVVSESMKRVRMSYDDVRRYVECLKELKDEQKIAKTLTILSITQIFHHTTDAFVGSWMTCYEPSDGLVSWVFIQKDWTVDIFEDISAVHAKAYELADDRAFGIVTYGNTTNWPQVYVGVIERAPLRGV